MLQVDHVTHICPVRGIRRMNMLLTCHRIFFFPTHPRASERAQEPSSTAETEPRHEKELHSEAAPPPIPTEAPKSPSLHLRRLAPGVRSGRSASQPVQTPDLLAVPGHSASNPVVGRQSPAPPKPVTTVQAQTRAETPHKRSVFVPFYVNVHSIQLISKTAGKESFWLDFYCKDFRSFRVSFCCNGSVHARFLS